MEAWYGRGGRWGAGWCAHTGGRKKINSVRGGEYKQRAGQALCSLADLLQKELIWTCTNVKMDECHSYAHV